MTCVWRETLNST